MKSLIKTIILILICLSIYYCDTIGSFYFFEKGKNYLTSKDYQKAYKCLRFSTEKNPKNLDFQYYYTLALLNSPQNSEIQDQLFKISKTQTKSAELAKNQLEKIQSQLLYGLNDNYIESVTLGSLVVHWSLKTMPLKIYFGATSQEIYIPEYYLSSIKKALDTWIKNLDVDLSYIIVNKPDNADINILFTPKIYDVKYSENSYKLTNGATTPIIENNILKRMEIKFRALRPDDHPYSRLEIYNTALHEFGHALGIMGHSYNENDIMYPVTNDKQSTEYLSVYRVMRLKLSQRDINTINLLYKINPDISNLEPNETPENLASSKLVLGDKTEILQRKLTEALNYVRTVPDTPAGWISVGNIYNEIKDYINAKEAFSNALKYAESEQDIANIYYNIASSEYALKNYKEALSYAQRAINIDGKKQEAIELKAYINEDIKEYDKAISIYKTLIEQNSQNIDYSYNLTVLYLHKFDFANAGKTINKLIAANPSAENDKRIKRLSFLSYFFK